MSKQQASEGQNKLSKLVEFVQKEYNEIVKPKKYGQDQIAERIGIDITTLAKAKAEFSHVNDRAEGIYLKILKNYEIRATSDAPDFEFEFLPPKQWIGLGELARELALNLVDVSMNFSEKNLPHLSVIAKEATLAYLNSTNDRMRQRFIVVVGAGASHAATGGKLPLAQEAMQSVKDAIKNEEIKFLNELVDSELNRLKLVYKAPIDDFETILVACSRFKKDTVVASLKKLCGNRHIPALSYEILAHLLKHRFVDAVINFNYDEVLDNAIEEEISNREYFYIYSDGHCPNEYKDMLIDNRLKQPVFIKPHGTISHINTLRFTREAYFSMAPEIRDTIYDLFKANVYENEDNGQNYLPLNLIIIGFSMKSVEFNGLIQQYLEEYPKREIKFWFFDKKTKLSDFNLDLSPEQQKRVEGNSTFFDLNRNSLEEILTSLWELIEEQFKEPYRPRGIQRHQLLNALLTGHQKRLLGENRDLAAREIEYFRDRFFIELVITILQSDGMINASQIVEERVGKFFQLLEDRMLKTKLEVSLRDLICQQFGLNVHKGFVWDTYILERPNQFYNQNDLGTYLFRKLKKVLSQTADLEEKDFLRLAAEIRKRNLMKITPNYIHPHNNVFSHLKKENILNTSLSWIYRYRTAIERTEDWDLMLVISEKGRFLNQDIKNERIKGKKVELILCSFDTKDFDDISDDQKNLFKGVSLLSGDPLFLPWWVHNQHMVLFLKRTQSTSGHWRDCWIPKEGFYYQSRLLSRKINPVNITNEEDCLFLLYTFVNHWYRAKIYTKNGGVPIVANMEELEGQIQALFSLYDGK